MEQRDRRNVYPQPEHEHGLGRGRHEEPQAHRHGYHRHHGALSHKDLQPRPFRRRLCTVLHLSAQRLRLDQLGLQPKIVARFLGEQQALLILDGDSACVQDSVDWANTPMTALSEAQWHCLEMHVTAPATAAVLEFWVDGAYANALTANFSAGSNWTPIDLGDPFDRQRNQRRRHVLPGRGDRFQCLQRTASLTVRSPGAPLTAPGPAGWAIPITTATARPRGFTQTSVLPVKITPFCAK